MKWFKVAKWTGCGLLLVFGLMFIACAGLFDFVTIPIRISWVLVSGWVTFLARKIPQIEVKAEAVVSGLLGIVLLLVLTQIMLSRYYNRPAVDEKPAKAWRFRWTAALVATLLLMFAAGVSMVGITHQTTWMLTSDDRVVRIEVRGYSYGDYQMGKFRSAFTDYVDKNGSLPQSTLFDTHGKALHGWQTQLLPYVNETRLYDQIVFTKPWNDAVNQPRFKQRISAYEIDRAIETDADGYGLTNYAMNSQALGGERAWKLGDFTSGLSNVLFVGEVSTNLKPWGHPFNARDPKLGLHQSPDGFGGPIKGQTIFLMGDGSVRTFRDGADREFLELLANPSGR